MKPEAGDALLNGAMTLMGEVAPMLEGGYGSGTVNTIGAMMMIAAQEIERAADARVKAISELRALFSDAAATIADKPLADRLSSAALSSESDFLISTLSKRLAELRALLIDLHIHVEGASDEVSREIEDRIWQHLSKDAERFGISLG